MSDTFRREYSESLAVTGAAGNSNSFGLGPSNAMTITYKVATTAAPPGPGQPGAPTVKLQGTNDAGLSYWVDLTAPAAAPGPIAISPDGPRYKYYRLVHASGDAADQITYSFLRFRAR